MWRIKWHPYEDDRLLLASMHGGCRVVHVDGMKCQDDANDTTAEIRVCKEFVKHTSMAYGADWLVSKHPNRKDYYDAAASCSFYDRALYLWDARV